MPHYLSDEELKRTAPAEIASFRSPIPTQIVSNGEFNPLPQTREQQRVEARIKAMADELGPKHGMNRRQFFASTAGMAAAFLAPLAPEVPATRAALWPQAIGDLLAGALVRVQPGSPRHLALVEAIRRLHRRAAMAADRDDKRRAASDQERR